MANIQEVSYSPETFEKRHNTAPTSRQSFRIINADGTRVTQKHRVCQAIQQHQPITQRRLCEITSIEKNSVCRCVRDLLDEEIPAIREAFEALCPTTGKRVTYYSMSWWRRRPSTSEQLKLIE